jgi:hypothetical protein
MDICPFDLQSEVVDPPPKTDKDGNFYSENKGKPLKDKSQAGMKVKISGKLVSPGDISVKGDFTFNGTKKSFRETKAGNKVELGVFVVKEVNAIKLEGVTIPATPNTTLKFEAYYAPCT